MRSSTKSLAIPLSVLATLAAWADDGRIPIWEPGTIIDRPGSYYLARDLTFEGNQGIVIEAPHVDLDLNGRKITGVFEVGWAVWIKESTVDVAIRNGRLTGVSVGIYSQGSSTMPKRLRIERLQITNINEYAIYATDTGYVEMANCYIGDSTEGVVITGGSFELRGRVADNSLNGSGLDIGNGHGMEIRGNLIVPGSCESGTLAGLYLGHGDGNRVVENVVVGGDCPGVKISHGERNVVRDSVSVGNGSVGIHAGLSSATRISGNVLNGNTEHGVWVCSAFTGEALELVEGNVAQGNGRYGVRCAGLDSDGNASSAYRNNMLRGNVLGPVNDPENALTNEGGNIE